MKKHIRPVIAALSMILTVTPLSAEASAFSDASALHFSDENQIYKSEYEFDYEFDDTLKEAAKKLGWGTDNFVFPNFNYSANPDMSNPCYRDFMRNSTYADMFAESEYNLPQSSFKDILFGGHCYGISVLEILNHNGYITPSDLQEGAEKLIDVNRENKAKDMLSYYQVSQIYTLFDTYFRWNFRTYSDEERVKQLLETAENAANEGKYFLIIEDATGITKSRYVHAVAGIGIADGHWVFNGEIYDKCILTYDSNAIREDSLPDFVAWGFNEGCSIFINSETYKATIPNLEAINSDNELNFFSLDDETLMNHLGLINPSAAVNTDVSGINKIEILSDGECSINVTDLDDKIYDGIESSYKKEQEALSKTYYCRGKEFDVSNFGTDLNVSFSDTERTFRVKTRKNAEKIIADENCVAITSKDSGTDFDVTLIQNKPDLPYFFYRFAGDDSSDISISKVDDGIILSGSNGIKCIYDFMKPEFDSYGILVNNYDFNSYANADGIIASGNVMLKYDNGLDKFMPYVDMDNDNIYESEVQKGDANCDGKINISDASVILASYAAKAVGNTSYANMSISDFDDDGAINIADASKVLYLYASNAVKDTNN